MHRALWTHALNCACLTNACVKRTHASMCARVTNACTKLCVHYVLCLLNERTRKWTHSQKSKQCVRHVWRALLSPTTVNSKCLISFNSISAQTFPWNNRTLCAFTSLVKPLREVTVRLTIRIHFNTQTLPWNDRCACVQQRLMRAFKVSNILYCNWFFIEQSTLFGRSVSKRTFAIVCSRLEFLLVFSVWNQNVDSVHLTNGRIYSR